MPSSPSEVDLFIIGAGPTGLSLALQCLRYGLSFRIIDQKETTTELSKALVLHARSLEIYDQLGLAKEAIKQGEKIKQLCFLREGKPGPSLSFEGIGDQLTPFPFFLLLEQSKNEKLLYQKLQAQGAMVHWQEEFVSFTPLLPQEADSPLKILSRGADGQEYQTTAGYLVGCDGAHSALRHQLQLKFEGSTQPRLFYVGDVTMETDFESRSIYGAFHGNRFIMLFPMQSENRWRLIGSLPESHTSNNLSNLTSSTTPEEVDDLSKITFEDAQLDIETLIPGGLTIEQLHWFSPYKIHTRHVTSFQKGSCFLAGDAAHVHTPAGGQGMNTGIQDAYNLAWKIAMVQQKKASASGLLPTYHQERLANAKKLLKTTDHFFDLAAGQHWYMSLLREALIPLLPQLISNTPSIRDLLFSFLSQIEISYRDHSLSAPTPSEFNIHSGDHLPYILVEGQSLYQRCAAPNFHLLFFCNDPEERASFLKKWAKNGIKNPKRPHNPHSLITPELLTLPLSTEIITHFGYNQPFLLLLRPDHYIAQITTDLSSETIMSYWKRLSN